MHGIYLDYPYYNYTCSYPICPHTKSIGMIFISEKTLINHSRRKANENVICKHTYLAISNTKFNRIQRNWRQER